MTKTRYIILGDTHGDFLWTLKVLDHAKALKIDTIFQVGDWGFIWPGCDQSEGLALALRARKQRMYFIDGNHDVHPVLRTKTDWPAELVYMRRGTRHAFINDDGRVVTVGALGGAASIDKNSRIEGQSWWPEEEILDSEIVTGQVDILLTHDAPERPRNLSDIQLPMNIVYRCQGSISKVQECVRRSNPRILYHGHYHWPYKSSFEGTEVIGLNCNGRLGGYIVVDHNFEPYKGRITGWVTK